MHKNTCLAERMGCRVLVDFTGHAQEHLSCGAPGQDIQDTKDTQDSGTSCGSCRSCLSWSGVHRNSRAPGCASRSAAQATHRNCRAPGSAFGETKKTASRGLCQNGRSRGIRTHDPVIKSHLLYQLSYAPIHPHAPEWSELRDSNPRQPPWQGGTLPTELSSHLVS